MFFNFTASCLQNFSGTRGHSVTPTLTSSSSNSTSGEHQVKHDGMMKSFVWFWGKEVFLTKSSSESSFCHMFTLKYYITDCMRAKSRYAICAFDFLIIKLMFKFCVPCFSDIYSCTKISVCLCAVRITEKKKKHFTDQEDLHECLLKLV